jgi:pimeloyl-ACP methyl ester carboxylesterase
MPTLAHDGIELAYDEHGTGEPALVFVHGWTCDRRFFGAQVDHFAPRHRVVALDLRGHGDSGKPRGPYPIAAHVTDVIAVMATLRMQGVVVGHSMGGAVALQLAAEHPERVKAVVMIDPVPLSLPAELRRQVEGLARAIEAGDQVPRRQFVERLFMPTSDPAVRERVVRTMMATPDHVAVEGLKSVLEFDGISVASRCKVPALHLMTSPAFNPPHLMAERLPGVVQGWTVGSGHFSMLEVPDQVNSMIGGFLRHHLPAGPPTSGP